MFENVRLLQDRYGADNQGKLGWQQLANRQDAITRRAIVPAGRERDRRFHALFLINDNIISCLVCFIGGVDTTPSLLTLSCRSDTTSPSRTGALVVMGESVHLRFRGKTESAANDRRCLQ